MEKPYSAKTVANTIIRYAKDMGIKDLTPLKLQKLVYFAHAWHLAFFDTPLIKEEVQAWQYGPVIPQLYHEFKHYGDNPINEYASELVFENGKLLFKNFFIPEEDEITHQFIREILKVYGKFTPIQLSNLSHERGSAWDIIAKEYRYYLPKHINIPNELIKTVFKKKLADGEKSRE